MSETDIVEAVFQSHDFTSREQAEAVTRATLRNLGRCLSVGEARDIAAPLPPDLSLELVDINRKRAKPMAYEEFIEQVGEEAALPDRAVEQDVQVVMAVLAQRVGEEELENAQAQLPPNYGRIFDVEPASIGRPFVDFVVERTAFDPDVDAEALVRAVLETLGVRLSRGEAEDLAQYLEGEAEQWLIDETSSDAADFSADEFVTRVARQADVSEETARETIQVVGNALSDIVPSEEIERALDQLPAGFGSLLALKE
ncbi:DUF2267 domain-containing protein [Halopenitus sp. H-Gu1]|uniref:DUF2267 domain-containing protein n=1 Tax=Halopenitus sp. H-Gu1 TaxID=3242697 RepID=UPI00359D0537